MYETFTRLSQSKHLKYKVIKRHGLRGTFKAYAPMCDCCACATLKPSNDASASGNPWVDWVPFVAGGGALTAYAWPQASRLLLPHTDVAYQI